MLWGPFLIKILLEKKFMGPMNSAQDPLEKLKRASQKKKKKRRHRRAEAVSTCYHNLIQLILLNIYIYIYIYFFFFF